jgi:trigger factor
MKVSSEKIENSQVALNVEMESGEKDKYFDIALEHISKKLSIPGFRKGKAPKSLIEQHVGKEYIFQEALEHLIPEAYEEALKVVSIVAIAEPHIELTTVEPIAFKAIVPVKPTITLGSYRDVRLEMEKKEIAESDIDQVIEQLRNQFGSLAPVERSIQYEDVISMDIEGKRDDKSILNRKDALYDVQQDSKYPVPGFSAKLIGANKDDHLDLSFTFPDDHEFKEIAGKAYEFSVTIKEVKQKELPEIDDEFAKNAGSASMEDLRSQIKASMQARVDEQARKTLEHNLLTRLIEQSAIEYPPVLVDKEIDHIVEEETRNFSDGIKGLENYLKNAKKTVEDHRNDLRPQATDRVKAYLIVSKIAEEEGITTSDEELDQSVENMAKGDETRTENIKAMFNLTRPRESLRDMLTINKAMDKLIKMVTGQEEQKTD